MLVEKGERILIEIFDEILRYIEPYENAEDRHERIAFENGDITGVQIHQYAGHILGSFSDYITELKEKYKQAVDFVVFIHHARWVPCKNNAGYKCSHCGARIKNSAKFNGNHIWCHTCGAKMDNGHRRD